MTKLHIKMASYFDNYDCKKQCIYMQTQVQYMPNNSDIYKFGRCRPTTHNGGSYSVLGTLTSSITLVGAQAQEKVYKNLNISTLTTTIDWSVPNVRTMADEQYAAVPFSNCNEAHCLVALCRSGNNSHRGLLKTTTLHSEAQSMAK